MVSSSSALASFFSRDCGFACFALEARFKMKEAMHSRADNKRTITASAVGNFPRAQHRLDILHQRISKESSLLMQFLQTYSTNWPAACGINRMETTSKLHEKQRTDGSNALEVTTIKQRQPTADKTSCRRRSINAARGKCLAARVS